MSQVISTGGSTTSGQNGGKARGISRRAALPGMASLAAGFTILPRHVLGGPGFKAPSDTLNIAGVGVGAMGAGYLRNCESENIAVLCDVDEGFAAKTYERYPKAVRYRDFRVMLDKEKGIDAVVVGTPDHTHAVIVMAALRRGKHIYCAKPLTRTLAESRMVTEFARKTGVATQMSVQSCGSEAAAAVCDWIWSGAIGNVRDVHVWSNRPIWPQGLLRPADRPQAPAGLDWDLWLGPAPYRPYHHVYHPFVWRGWWDFGTGALGDMACHAFHIVFRALQLEHAVSVHSSAAILVELVEEQGPTGIVRRSKALRTPETAPVASVIHWDFPARGALPPVRMTWYDGGLKPRRPAEIEPNRPLPAEGMLFEGDKGSLLTGFSGGPILLPEERMKAMGPPLRVAQRSSGHYSEWIVACKGGPTAMCEFNFGGLITEASLIGNIALRTGRALRWDAAKLEFINDPEANRYVSEPSREGWSI